MKFTTQKFVLYFQTTRLEEDITRIDKFKQTIDRTVTFYGALFQETLICKTCPWIRFQRLQFAPRVN